MSSNLATWRVALVIWGGLLVPSVCGCGPGARNAQAVAARDAASNTGFTVRIDRRDNGAAATARSAQEQKAIARELAFQMVGQAATVSGRPSHEARVAASQAAVIDAFTKALSEARRARGQSTSDFSAKIGPRLTFTHKALPDGDEVTVRIVSRGIESRFIVRDGELQHPPHDVRLLRQVFKETNGEFALIRTDDTSRSGCVQATVACYLPRGAQTSIPANLAVKPGQSDDAIEAP